MQKKVQLRGSTHLPGLDFVLVVVLEDTFITQAQPPRDSLLVLKKNIIIAHVCIHVSGMDRKRNRGRDTDIKTSANTFKLHYTVSPNPKLASCLSTKNKIHVVRV